MKRLLGLALLALGLTTAADAPASRAIKDILLAGTWTGSQGGAVTGYTADDTVSHTTLRIPCFGASQVRFMVGTTATQAWTTVDSAYVDSFSVFKVQVSDDSTTWKDMAISSTSGVRGIYWFGDQVQGAGQSMGTTIVGTNNSGYHTFNVVGDVSSANNVINTVPAAILNKYMRIQYTPFTRNTLAGALSTQGKRTQGVKGLKIIARICYDNP